MRALAVIAACVAVLVAPVQALGQETVAPPGNSGVDEYLETVPGADGNRPARGQDGGTGNRDSVDAGTRKQLESAGDDGRAAADLAAAGSASDDAGSTGTGGSDSGSGSKSGGRQVDPTASADPVVPAVISRTVSGDEGGMGTALPLILGATLLAAVAFVLGRRRGRAS